MKFILSVLLCIPAFAFTRAQSTHAQDQAQGVQLQAQSQDIVEPGSKSINQEYLKPRNVFEKLSWFDSTGKPTAQMVLNLVTRIDSAHKKLIFLQIRNDGKKDSTIAEWPSLRPIYSSETTLRGRESICDYSGDKLIRVIERNNGEKKSDTSYTINSPYLDGYLTDYLLGALPLKPGYHGRFTTGGGAPVVVTVKEVYTDVLTSGDGHSIQANLVLVDFNGHNVLYWIDKSSGEILKSVYRTTEGNLFMKSKI